ncbi:ATP-binding cassette domain-containing protein [Marinomonas ostreistagni]|uniref:ATP-binding cassette domain-containing protein n=1 Tax=Marinomonas ostreistagni TaxID=359209 RepID=UPI0019515AAC|nr:ATP-binding cassette domain-containing protein [Marinomonas ostreistagni]MBM6551872.1 ATP-binding cassette domain-containing protein [Marinomonas ostreistagni]
MNPAVEITITHGSLSYHNSNHAVLQDLKVTFAPNQWTCLLERSGCGKTSVLRQLAGLLDTQAQWQGSIRTSDQISLEQRIAYMAQQDLLLPWLSVFDNVTVANRLHGKPPTTSLRSHRSKA